MAVDARTEEFQHLELFDKFALFTNARIDRTTVPKGWYCYDFRGTGDDPGELRFIEESVVVNHSGSILMPEKLELPASGQLDAWDEFGFLDECDMTLREFCEVHDLPYPAEKEEFHIRLARPDEAGLFYAQHPSEDKSLVGRVTFVGDDAQEFTDAEAFLKCIREELPYFPTTGFRCEVLTDDPAVRKQVDDIFYDFFGELYLEIDDYYDFEYLAPHLDGADISLNELNDLAGQLAALDEVQGIAFEGLFSIEMQKKISTNGGIITLQDLRNLAASAKTDCYHIVDAADDTALGRFYAENDFIPELDGVPDSVFKMLDFTGIGRMMRQGENGVFVGGCYVVRDGEMTAAPPCSRELPKKPDYLFRVTLGLHPDLEDNQTVTLTLPASAEELKKAQKQLDADGWEGVVVLAYDGIIPQAAEFADLPAELETFNHFAEVVENMPSREKQLPKFKAVLRICQCSSVDQAISLAERLEHFYFDARIRNYADLVYDELENVIGDRQAEELRQCLDIEKYGRILQQGYNAEFTKYGMVTRDDFQPMDAPWQDESEVMDMQIT